MEEVFAVYIWSEDWWVFSNDTWQPNEDYYADSEVVSAGEFNDWDRVASGEAYHASVYYELDKTDNHGFKPVSIMVDNIEEPTRVEILGEEIGFDGTVVGEEELEYVLNQKDFYVSFGLTVDFTTDLILAARNEDEKESKIVEFITAQNDADLETAENMTKTSEAETFHARGDSRRAKRRAQRKQRDRNMMQTKRYMRSKRGAKNYSDSGYAETFGAEGGESASDSIAAESSQPVSGINPTPVTDGQWLAETLNRRAEAKHSYPHRRIEGDKFVHFDGKGRRVKTTDRGASISADRRQYRPRADLKPGQGHLGDFPRSKRAEVTRRAPTLSRTSRMRRRAESTYNPMDASPTADNPASREPSMGGAGQDLISTQSASVPPSDVKFAETVMKGLHECVECGHWNRNIRPGYTKCKKCGCTDFKKTKAAETALGCKTCAAEDFRACGCSTRRAEGPTNSMPSGDNPEDMTPVEAPADTYSAEMNYDNSLYGDQYFPDNLTARGADLGSLGEAPSAGASGQGVEQWQGSRQGPDMAAESLVGRRGLSFVGGIALIGLGLTYLRNRDSEESTDEELVEE